MSALAYKTVRFELEELKATRDSWTFAGYASTFGNIDEGGDVVLPGAFTDSLKSRPKPKLLWQHDSAEPIGVVMSLEEDSRGLKGEWKLSRTTRGQDAYTLLKDGALDSLSIGYIPNDAEYDDGGIRKLKSVDLLEVSVVSMPMNQQAIITDVKAASPEATQPATAEVERKVADRISLAQLKLRVQRRQLQRRGYTIGGAA